MSITHTIVCSSCEKSLWISKQKFLPESPEIVAKLVEFLNEHRTSEGEVHHIFYVDEHYESFTFPLKTECLS